MNLDSNFCTLDTTEIDKQFDVQKSEAELDIWTFDQIPELEELNDIFGEADQRKLAGRFQGNELFTAWKNTLGQILEYT